MSLQAIRVVGTGSHADNVTVTGLGPTSGLAAINVTRPNFRLELVTVSQTSVGLDLRETAPGATVENCLFTDYSAQAIWLSGNSLEALTVSNSRFISQAGAQGIGGPAPIITLGALTDLTFTGGEPAIDVKVVSVPPSTLSITDTLIHDCTLALKVDTFSGTVTMTGVTIR